MIATRIIISEFWNKGKSLAIKNTPAVTIVAEWIKAETEVGPSIASGSQLWRGNWADLPIAPTKNHRDKIVATFVDISLFNIALYKAGISNKSEFTLNK